MSKQAFPLKEDIVELLKSIDSEIKEKGYIDDLLSFESTHMLRFQDISKVDVQSLRQRIELTMGNYVVNSTYPVYGTPFKLLFKKASRRATRCTIEPLAQRISETNLCLLQCIEHCVTVIEHQQQQIMELEDKVQQISKVINGEVEKK